MYTTVTLLRFPHSKSQSNQTTDDSDMPNLSMDELEIIVTDVPNTYQSCTFLCAMD